MTLGELLVRLKADVGSFNSDIGRAGLSLNNLKGIASQLGSSLSIPMAGLSLLGVVAAREAAKFELAFARVVAVSGKTTKELGFLREELLGLSSQIPVAATELASIAEMGAQMGVSDAYLGQFVETVARFGSVADIAGDQAATMIARISQVNGLGEDKFRNLASAVLSVSTASNASGAEILRTTMQMQGLGANAGLSATQMVALSAAIISTGMKAEAGGTAIGRFSRAMAIAVDGGGPKLELFAKTAGKSMEEFQKIFKADAFQGIKAFLEGLGSKGIAEQAKILDKLGLSGVRVAGSISNLTRALDMASQQQEIANREFERGTSVVEKSDVVFDTTIKQWELFQNTVKEVAIRLGDNFLPALNLALGGAIALTKGLGELVKLFNLIPAGIRSILAPLLLATAALKTFGIGWGTMATAAVGGIGSVRAAVLAASINFGTFASAIAVVVAKFVAAAAAGYALGTAIRQIPTGFGGTVGEAWDAMMFQWESGGKTQAELERRDLVGDDGRVVLGVPKPKPAGAGSSGSSGSGAGDGLSGLDDEALKRYHSALSDVREEIGRVQVAHSSAHAQAVFEIDAEYKKNLEKANQTKATGEALKTLESYYASLRAEKLRDLELSERIAALEGNPAFDMPRRIELVDEQTAAYARQQEIATGLFNQLQAQNDQLEFHGGLLNADTEFIAQYVSALLSLEKAGLNSALTTEKLNAALEELRKRNPPDQFFVDPGLPGVSQADKNRFGGPGASDQDVLAAAFKRLEQVKTSTTDWGKAITSVKSSFELLGVSAESGLGRVISLFATAQSVGQDIGNSLANVSERLAAQRIVNSTTQNKVSGFDTLKANLKEIDWAQFVSGLMQAVSAFKQATDSASAFQRALGGAMVGAKVGGQIGAIFGEQGKAIGQAIGAGIGAIAGIFSEPSWVKVGKEAGMVLGTEISKEMAKEIEKRAKDLNITVKASALLSIPDLMSKAADPRKFIAPALDLLTGIANKSVPAKEGIQAMGSAFSQIVSAAMDAGRVGDAAMVAIIKRARELGLQIPEITAHVKEMVQKAVSAISGITGTKDKETGKITKGLNFAALSDHGSALGLTGTGVKSQAKDQALIFTTVFWSAVKELGLAAAVDSMAPAFDAINEKLTERFGADFAAKVLGGVGGLFEAFGEEGPARGALEGADALRGALEGIANAGYLTEDSFTAIQNQGVVAFDQMLAAGVPLESALLGMAPTIQAAVSASEQFGVPLTEDMQKLKEMAEQHGITFRTDPMLAMLDVLKKIAIALGADIPDAAAKASDSISGIQPPGTASGSAPHYKASLGFYSPKLPKDTLIQAHTGEEVVITPAGRRRGAQVDVDKMLAAIAQSASGGRGDQPVHVTIQLGNEVIYRGIERASKTGKVRISPQGVRTF